VNDARPTLSALLRCRAVDQDGRRIGHVTEVRCAGREGEPPRVTTLLIGPAGLLRRLGVRRGTPVEIPWTAVVDWQPGTVVTRRGGP
jgi:sporulation protein YlmC with PRC-barrel domain